MNIINKKRGKDMIKQYQVTLFDNTKKYRPVSCIINYEQTEDKDLSTDAIIKKAILKKGVEKICLQRYWTAKEIKQYNYIRGKVRLYDKEKIAKEAADRYNAIKEEHYQNGTWKRPKKEEKK